MSVVKFDKFVVIEAGKYTFNALNDLVGAQFTDKLRLLLRKGNANNASLLVERVFFLPYYVELPVKFSSLLKDQESTLITIPHLSIIWFTQYGNEYLRVTYGDDLFKVLQETKRLIALAKRAHTKTNDTKA